MNDWNQKKPREEEKKAATLPDGQPQTEKEPEVELTVSSDRMTAYLRVKPAAPGQEVPAGFLFDFLKKKGITYGILRDDVETFCKEKKFYAELVCAQGLEPVDEDDAQMEYSFRTEQNLAPKQKEDGTVDFLELGIVQSVSKGDVLCRILLPEKGKNGIDIYGHAVSCKKAKVPAFPSGSNTVMSQDRLTLSAAIDGCIEYKGSTLNVNDVFIVHGDVDKASGNIDFLGSVTVQGDVREGLTVKAGKDITVRGMVEGAAMEAGGNITIANGMKGMRSGRLCAKGNITSRYFENVTLECDGDVYADVLMNSTVSAGGSVVLMGRNALLVGGRVQAGHQIYAGSIGSESSVETEVVIESKQLDALLLGEDENPAELETRLNAARREDSTLKDRIGEYTRTVSLRKEDAERVRPLLKALAIQKSRNAAVIDSLEKKIKAAHEQENSCMAFRVSGVHTVYAGTKITIGSFVQLLENDYDYTKFYSTRENLANGPLLPSDIMQSY